MKDKYLNLADNIVRQYVRQYSYGPTDRWCIDYDGLRFVGNSPQQVRTNLAEHIQNRFNEPPQIIDLR